MPYQDALCQLYKSNPPYRTYSKNDEKKVYQFDDKAMKD